MSTVNTSYSEQIRVKGLVQGVGFRPTVYRLAKELNIRGEVLNDGEGVSIIVQASYNNIDIFIQNLQQQCPPLARIDQVLRSPLPTSETYNDFSITQSQNTDIHTGIVPDAATCEFCLNDISNPQNRRHGYAFTNCTHCGPRLSIVRNIPYDRKNTSMSNFQLCPTCLREYQNPEDRRFHAQPNACPDCGPVLSLTDNQGENIDCQDQISTAVSFIKQGFIVAIKGIGGFQLACDAANEKTVLTLRRRKHRPDKSFALMAKDIQQVERYCHVGNEEKEALQSHVAPIVILQRKTRQHDLSEHIAPAQHTLGFMLPYSPLHHLLMQHLDYPVVLTSGNVAEEPQCIDNQQAINKLGIIADYFILHDREIVNRIDDSVIRIVDNEQLIYRRARGFAPAPVALPQGFDLDSCVLACGGEMKNSFCLVKDQQAILSQYMGNLENVSTFTDYLKNMDLYHHLFQFDAKAIVIDKHPEYLSSKHGKQLAIEKDLPLIEVQHHHAHIAACLVDNLWPLQQGKVIGVSLDGLGFGDDGTIWGGEFLVADYRQYERLARFKPVPMPGATQAILEPWRNTYAHLSTHCDWSDLNQRFSKLDLFNYLHQKPLDIINRMMVSNINSPLSSSCGRLFDAVAAAIGLCHERISYEGQAAIELESLIKTHELESVTAYPFELEHSKILEINPAPMWNALLSDLQNKVSQSKISARFHLFITKIIVTTVKQISRQTGIKFVALSGGVFQNTTLFQLTLKQLQQAGFNVLTHQNIPANDGGLSLGQAAIACALLQTVDPLDCINKYGVNDE